jgi:hypothetical protein
MTALARGLLAASLTLIAASAHAIDSFGLDVGTGDESANLVSVSARWNWQSKWFTEGEWYLGGYWEANAGHWNGRAGTTGNDSITDIGITPVFRLQPHKQDGVTPWVEGAIGFHYLSDTKIGNKNLSTHFQFGDHLGAGVSFGKKQSMELGYRFQHFSNAGIKRPNPGINFHMVRFGYRF